SKAGSVLEKIMPKGYRHKAMFDDIKGGDDLTKYGTYTNAEAAQIRNLKSSGANTSANLKGGMSLEVQDKIAAQARKAGLDPVMMQKMAAMESGGNPNAISSTGAIGIYQFVGQTASGVGIKDRFDVDQNIEGGMKLTLQNKAMLEGEKLPVTAENLYMMHQLGPRAAMEVIRGAKQGKAKSELSSDTQKAMNLNYGAKSKTAADYIATNKNALDARYAAVTKNTGSVSATAVAQAAAPSQKAATGGTVQAGSPSPILVGATPTYSAMASLPQVATTNVSLPTPPTVRPPVQPQTVPELVPVPVPLSGGASSRPIQVSMEQPDVGRDLSDRRIAHVATGGIGGWVA
ncbi:MAG: transglycosylase SLT domain-containing protein, partial [Macromonas sp.]